MSEEAHVISFQKCKRQLRAHIYRGLAMHIYTYRNDEKFPPL